MNKSRTISLLHYQKLCSSECPGCLQWFDKQENSKVYNTQAHTTVGEAWSLLNIFSYARGSNTWDTGKWKHIQYHQGSINEIETFSERHWRWFEVIMTVMLVWYQISTVLYINRQIKDTCIQQNFCKIWLSQVHHQTVGLQIFAIRIKMTSSEHVCARLVV